MLEASGVTVEYLNMPRGRVTLKALRELWRFLHQYRPDVVQTWMYHADLIGGVMSRLAGVRSIFWGVRNSNLDPNTSSSTTRMVARVCALLSRVVPLRIISCSQQAVFVHQALGYARKKFIIIPNGYPLGRYKPDSAVRMRLRTEWGIDSSTRLIGMVARFDPQKDHANLLTALKYLKDQDIRFRCVLVGTGMTADNQKLQEWITVRGLNEFVKLLGRRDDIPSIMNALDLHVLCSRYGEAFPNVLAEAMACGTPCVTTDVGDAAMIVGDTGWVVKHGDPDSLLLGIEQALAEMENTRQWSLRAEAARARIVDMFSIEQMVDSYHKAWKTA